LNPQVFLKPMAGDIDWMRPDRFTQTFSVISNTALYQSLAALVAERDELAERLATLTSSATPDLTSHPTPNDDDVSADQVSSQDAPVPELAPQRQTVPGQPSPRRGRPPGSKNQEK
jgi:hypothetical protein